MHPLLRHARRSLVNGEAVRPTNAIYDYVQGLWNGPNGPLCDDPPNLPQSKKFDVETGEDQKGQ